ncbi:hypothetical protein [Halpernia frigidisoli]|uniref:Uncharacterized protein n=1 Tax=Halpernia frigidisoli TaxID=1125876 RepID=A0A1I3ED11_9FLAO|nr:hypothetical protein [Halpernia frigidisoli]SFH96798.1 hypothetical protein SAMN05443292_1004 [Halpernia frigidisoli]
MKKAYLLFILISNLYFSQEYFFLDSLKSEFKINKYNLETKDIYKINKNIEVYNVFTSKNEILLLSVLPDLDEKILSGFDEKGYNWMPVDSAVFRNKIISNNKLRSLIFGWKSDNKPENKTLKYKLIKKANGKYYVSKLCLTEFFVVSNLKLPIITSYGTINTAENKTTIEEFEKSFKKQMLGEEFIMDVRTNNFHRNIDNPYIFKIYLSKKFKIKDQTAFQFWTFDGWWEHDGYNEYRGIDRFLYIPEKGIVGGSYDFYFRLKPKNSSIDYYAISNDKLWENIIDEKIMLATEFQ